MKKLITRAAVLALTLFAPLALALPTAALADAAGTGAGLFTSILVGLASNPEVLALLVSFAVGGGITLYRSWKKDKAEAHLRWLANAINVAYYSVNEVAIRTPNTIDNKVARALDYFREEMARRGYTATPIDEATAKAQWTAMHGVELTAQKLAAQGAGAIATGAALAAVTALPTKGTTPGPS